ncbi:MAG: hypothetical protein IRZ08_16305, partial [Frankia sp.]|nr:hypothetical protein [Frankia sp.]
AQAGARRRAGTAAAGRAGERRPAQPAGALAVAVAEPVELDPAEAVARARRLCMQALANAAELRGVLRASTSLSVGLVTAGACLLAGVVAGVLRVAVGAEGLPCLAAALVIGGGIVSVATEAGPKAALRSALLAAGTAGAVVLATLRVAPSEPAGIIGSLLALALAVRFGLGVGAPASAQAPPARGSRR